MTSSTNDLGFHEVDAIAYAAANKTLYTAPAEMKFSGNRIGPVLELLHLHTSGRVPPPVAYLQPNPLTTLVAALSQPREIWRQNDMGFIRARRTADPHEHRFTSFLMAVKRSAHHVAGLSKRTSGQLAAAIRELENNIHEHAHAPETGFVAYKADRGTLEFVVSDRGIGVLESLRVYRAYPDAGTALLAALKNGVSRYGPGSNRGHGFRPLFQGLVSLHGELRFRSGDYALTMDGTNPALPSARVIQKTTIAGLFVSVRCSVQAPERLTLVDSHEH